MITRAIRYYFRERSNWDKTADSVDVIPMQGVCWEAYLGKWYEWARYETPFEYGMDNVHTVYEAMDNGDIAITNCGTDEQGKTHKARAIASRDGEGILQVSFIAWMRFLSTPYIVLYVDEEYSHALVSNASGSCLWLLGRAPSYTEAQLTTLCTQAAARGFNVQRLRFTHQVEEPTLDNA